MSLDTVGHYNYSGHKTIKKEWSFPKANCTCISLPLQIDTNEVWFNEMSIRNYKTSWALVYLHFACLFLKGNTIIEYTANHMGSIYSLAWNLLVFFSNSRWHTTWSSTIFILFLDPCQPSNYALATKTMWEQVIKKLIDTFDNTTQSQEMD